MTCRNNSRRIGFDGRTLCAALMVLSAGSVWAPAFAAQPTAPAKAVEAAAITADEVLDRANEAMWGKTGEDRTVKTLEMRATFTVPAQGLEASIVSVFDTEAGNMRTDLEIPNYGKEVQGVIGGKAWSESSTTGPRVMTGDEAKQSLQQADFYADLDYKTKYATREYVGTEQVDGATCHKIIVTRATGDAPETRWYDGATWMLVKQSSTAATQMGKLEIVTSFSDYREIEGAPGVKMPFSTAIAMAGMQQVITIESVAVNPELPADRFDPPPAVQKLLG